MSLVFEPQAKEIRAVLNGDLSLGDVCPFATLPERRADLGPGVLDELRPELYAIAAVFTDVTLNYFERFRTEHPPFGLIEKMDADGGELVAIEEVESIYDLRVPLSHSIDVAQKEIFESFGDYETGLQPWVDRMEAILEVFGASEASPGGNYASTRAFMNGGYGTALEVCARTLDLVNRASREFAPDASDAEIIETARRSVRLPLRIARTFKLEHLFQNLNALGSVRWDNMFTPARWFDLERFVIKPDKNNPNILDIGINGESLQDVEDPEKLLDPSSYSLLGCPALTDLSRLEDPFTSSVDRIYKINAGLVADLCLWRSEKSAPRQKPPMI